MERVIIELVVSAHLSGAVLVDTVADRLPGVEIDRSYAPVEITPRPEDADRLSAVDRVVVVRGTLAEGGRAALEAEPEVLRVWSEAYIAPFDGD